MIIKSFNDFLDEDGTFASVGVAPEGNVNGMGNVTPPTSSSTGSGDVWDSLFKPFSLLPINRKRKKPKRKAKGPNK